MPLFEIGSESLIQVQEESFSRLGIQERGDLQRFLRDQIEVIEENLFLISEEFGAWEGSQRRIDLLAIDKEAKLVVIELKAVDDGGHMELQAIRYAAMVSAMTFAQAEAAHRAYLAKRSFDRDATVELLNFLEWDEPDEERFGQGVRTILVSPGFSSELTTTALWLNEQGIDLKCVQARPHAYQGKALLDVRQIIPLPEAADMQVRVREKERAEQRSRNQKAAWTGVWYVNIGMAEGNPRDWETCRRLGFLSAGGGAKYSKPLRKLSRGQLVAAYQKGRGYLGVGRVTRERQPVEEFRLRCGSLLIDQCPQLASADARPECQEYAVGIEWLSTKPLEEAKTFNGAFANQNIVCRLCDAATLTFLRSEFGLIDKRG